MSRPRRWRSPNAGPDEMKPRFCWAPHDALARRRREDIVGVVLHRIEVSQEDPTYADTPEGIMRFFLEHPTGVAATGGQMPYPLLIAAEGTVTQCVPLDRVTPHARSYNPSHLGLALVGDFRRDPPAAAQYEALVQVCAWLLSALDCASTALVGHDGLAGGAEDAQKVCPGPYLSLENVRRDVAEVTHPLDWDFVWTRVE